MRELTIGLDSWIIQDGNYGEFEAGCDYRFALEFTPTEVAPWRDGPPSLAPLVPSMYSFSGQVLAVEPRLTLLDVGVLCYAEGLLPDVFQRGASVAGRLYLGIDPFFWLVRHAKRADLPALVYPWRVETVLLETTPWAESVAGSERSAGPRTFVEVPHTNSWEDDHGHAHYALRCRQLGPASSSP